MPAKPDAVSYRAVRPLPQAGSDTGAVTTGAAVPAGLMEGVRLGEEPELRAVVGVGVAVAESCADAAGRRPAQTSRAASAALRGVIKDGMLCGTCRKDGVVRASGCHLDL
jgi:hypothetical protein